MLTSKSMFKFLDEGVHAEVLDFPGVITGGTDLDEARRLLASALVDAPETNLVAGDSPAIIQAAGDRGVRWALTIVS